MHRAPDVTLVFPHSVTSSLEDESTTEQRTLLDLGLAYRASLVAVLATTDTSQAFKVILASIKYLIIMVRPAYY